MRTMAGSNARVVLPVTGGTVAGSAAAVVLDAIIYKHLVRADAVAIPAGDSRCVALGTANSDAVYSPTGEAEVNWLAVGSVDAIYAAKGECRVDLNLNVLPCASVFCRSIADIASPALSGTRLVFGEGNRVDASVRNRLAIGANTVSSRVFSMQSADTIGATFREELSHGLPLSVGQRMLGAMAERFCSDSRTLMDQADAVAEMNRFRLLESAPANAKALSHLQPGVKINAGRRLHSAISSVFLIKHDLVWGRARKPSGFRPILPGSPPPPPHWGGGEPGVPLVLPLRGFYRVINQAVVTRVSDGANIECSRVSIESDEASWSRRFSLDVLWADRAKVQVDDGPVEVEISVNGVVWRAVVNKSSESQRFNANSFSVTGVSRSWVLGDFQATKRTYTNAVDTFYSVLAAAEIDLYGWTIIWLESLVDALVPAGIYNIVQQSPMAAVKRIVETPGGFVSTHRTADSLIARPRYPKFPWEMSGATPDVSLPADSIKQQTLEWNEPAFINGVFVSGGRVGKVSHVRRDGTDGMILGDDVVDDLLVSSAANGARGAMILADSIKRKTINVSMPIYPEFGVLEPGQIVEVTNFYPWKGIVRSSNVTAQREGDKLIVMQNFTAERYFD